MLSLMRHEVSLFSEETGGGGSLSAGAFLLVAAVTSALGREQTVCFRAGTGQS